MRSFLLLAAATLSLSVWAVAPRLGEPPATRGGQLVRSPRAGAPLSAHAAAPWASRENAPLRSAFDDAYGAELAPGPEHEAEGPTAIAASHEGSAVLDPLRGLVHFYDPSGAPAGQLSLDALGRDALSALDLAPLDEGGVALLLGRGAGAVAILDGRGQLTSRADLAPDRGVPTGLSALGREIWIGFDDARAWQPLAPSAPLRRGLPSPGGDCNGALLADGRAIARCHGPGGLREVWIAPPEGTALAAVEAVVADAEGGLCAALALREGGPELRRVALRVDALGRESWAELGPGPTWFTHRAVAFTPAGSVLRMTGGPQGLRLLRGGLRAGTQR